MSTMSKASNMIKAANSYKLPSQLIECLVASGYESISAVAAITELTTIENFFRTNSHIFSPDEINRIYGRFASDPDRFCIIPGHQTQLKGFIEYCRRFNKESKGSVTLASLSSEKSQKRMKSQSNRARPVKIIKAEDKLAILAQEALNPQSETGSNAGGSGFAFIQSPDENELVLPLIQTDGRACILPSQQQAECLAHIFKRLQNRIKNWCLTSPFEEIQQLKFRTDYDIHMSPVYEAASIEEKEKSLRLEEQFGCQVHVTCLPCSRVIRLHPQRGGFCTSNVFRHFVSCRVKKLRKSDTSPAMIQFLIREAPADQSTDEIEVHEEQAEEEDGNEIDDEHKETTTMEECQEMIYVSENMVDEDKEMEEKHLVPEDNEI